MQHFNPTELEKVLQYTWNNDHIPVTRSRDRSIFENRERLLPGEQHNQHGLDPKGKSQNTPSYQFEVQKAELCEK